MRRAVLIPSFVADCLETLEELSIRGVEVWRQNGGETLQVVPAPNARDGFAEAVAEIAAQTSPWLGGLREASAPEIRTGRRGLEAVS